MHAIPSPLRYSVNSPVVPIIVGVSLLAPACSSNSGNGGAPYDGSASVDSGDDGSGGTDAGAPESGSVAADGSAAVADCTKAQGYCISAAVVRHGQQLSCTATSLVVGAVAKLFTGAPTPRWSIQCQDQANQVHAVVIFPVQAAGSFDFTVSPDGGTPAIQFSVTAYDVAQAATAGSMTESSGNAVSGRLMGSVDSAMTGTGTLTASWAQPAAGCQSGDSPNPCVDGSVTLTFHVPLPQ
jgi:hypothetical protein